MTKKAATNKEVSFLLMFSHHFSFNEFIDTKQEPMAQCKVLTIATLGLLIQVMLPITKRSLLISKVL